VKALLLALVLATLPAMTNEDVIALTKAGLSADVIVEQISKSSTAFRTGVADLIALKSAHVDDAVVAAMVHAGHTAQEPMATPAVPAVRFGGVLIDLPGLRTAEGTLTVGSDGLTYDAPGFGTISAPWSQVESVCFESAFFGSLFVRVHDRFTGTGAVKVGRVVLLKCAPKALRPAYDYLKRVHPDVHEDCTDRGKDV
jgi:hypothetical protein